MTAPAVPAGLVPPHVTAALYAPLLAAMAVLASVRWWGGEPLFLRAGGAAIYAWGAVTALVVAVWLRKDRRQGRQS
jgi:hypothetical protein